MLIERVLVWVYHYLAFMKLRSSRPTTPGSAPHSDHESNTLAEERDGTGCAGLYLPYQYDSFAYSR